jgi:hypothetical protein
LQKRSCALSYFTQRRRKTAKTITTARPTKLTSAQPPSEIWLSHIYKRQHQTGEDHQNSHMQPKLRRGVCCIKNGHEQNKTRPKNLISAACRSMAVSCQTSTRCNSQTAQTIKTRLCNWKSVAVSRLASTKDSSDVQDFQSSPLQLGCELSCIHKTRQRNGEGFQTHLYNLVLGCLASKKHNKHGKGVQ